MITAWLLLLAGACFVTLGIYMLRPDMSDQDRGEAQFYAKVGLILMAGALIYSQVVG